MQIGVELSKAVQNRRIFVVDDDEIFRAALQFMLHDDYETHEIASVDAALTKAKEWRPDLLLVAESIVRAHGAALLARLGEEIPGVKILVVVEAAVDGFGKECIEAGADGAIAKPLKIEFVRQKVDALFGNRKAVTIPLSVLTTR
jgi:CheY-like chemotaxis protein